MDNGSTKLHELIDLSQKFDECATVLNELCINYEAIVGDDNFCSTLFNMAESLSRAADDFKSADVIFV